MDEADKDVDHIRELMRELQNLREEQAELEEHVRKTFERDFAELDGVEQSIQAARKRMDDIVARMRESDPQAFEDLASAEREIAHKEAELKAACYSLPVARLKKSSSFIGHGLKVSLSRATIRRSYRPELLKKHPELEHMFVDGDPVVVKSINTAILDRLVAEGKFDAAEAKAFLEEDKIRNPQVRIRTADAEDEDEDE